MIERSTAESFDASVSDFSYERVGRPGLPRNVVATLLDKLGSDDTFRDLFQKNPAAALKQIGVQEPEAFAICMTVTKLASKDAIKASSHALTTQLTGTLGQQPITLNAR
jgi:putative modified peptide